MRIEWHKLLVAGYSEVKTLVSNVRAKPVCTVHFYAPNTAQIVLTERVEGWASKVNKQIKEWSIRHIHSWRLIRILLYLGDITSFPP